MRGTPHLSVAQWRKSSHSNTDGGNCVEVGEGLPAVVPVRDSTRPDGPALLFPAASWSAFLTGLTTRR
jgi:hypothetical protein